MSTDTTTADAEAPDAEDFGSGTLEVLPPAQLPDMAAITTLREHVGAMRDAKFFAEGMCYSALVPDRFRGKPGDGAAAILFGAELGLSPIASLRSIIVVHGQPGLEARTMKALLKSKGYRFKTHEITDDACDIEAWSPDGSESERCRYTMADAIKAKYVPVEIEGKPGQYEKNSNGKLQGNMKYLTEPKKMLRAKATAVVCREIAPHILLGMPYSSDELETEDWAEGAAAAPKPAARRGGRGVSGLRERFAQQQPAADVVDAEVVDVEPGQGVGNAAGDGAEASSGTAPQDPPQDQAAAVKPLAPATRKKWENRMFALLAEGDCAAREDQIIVISGLAGRTDADLFEHRTDPSDVELRNIVNALHAAKTDGSLGALITDLLNSYVARQAEAEEPGPAAGEQTELGGDEDGES